MTDVKSVPKQAVKFATNKEAAAFYKKKMLGSVKKQPNKEKKNQFKLQLQKMHAAVDKARAIVKAAVERKEGSFLSISTDEKGQVKTAAVVSPQLAEASMAREFMKSALGLRPYKARLQYNVAMSTSGTNAQLTQNLSVDIASAQEWASWQSIFDEVRCLKWMCRYLVSQDGVTTASAASTIPAFFAAAMLQTATSSPGLLQATRHVGPVPMVLGDSTNSIGIDVVQPVTKYGYIELDSGPLVSGATEANPSSNAPIQGDWVPTSATSGQAVVGYANAIIDPLGTGRVSYLRTFVFLDVEFRLRQ